MRVILFLIFLCLFNEVYSQKGLEIHQLTNNTFVYTTYRAYKGSLFPANGMFIITETGAVIIDTPWDTTQFQPLLDSIKIKYGRDVLFSISTHSHSDRTAGINYFNSKGINTYTSFDTYELCIYNEEIKPSNYFISDTTFNLGENSLTTYFAGQGHTSDNIVIWIDKERILYGGCLVKSTDASDLGYLGDASPTEWPISIQNIQEKFPNPSFIVPGHQSWTSLDALSHTLDLLQQNNK